MHGLCRDKVKVTRFNGLFFFLPIIQILRICENKKQ